MYTETDLQVVLMQRRKRWTILLVPLAALAALMISAFIARVEWLTMSATIAGGSLLIAGYDLFVKPLSDYATHVDNMLHGRRREVDLPLESVSADVSMVDGVRYYAMRFTDRDEKGKPCDRLFYYDAEKPLPDFAVGEMLHIVFHDKEIACITRSQQA